MSPLPKRSSLDVAVRIGELPDADLIAKRLGYNDRVLAASPEYLAEHGTPASPEHLEAYNFILYSPPSSDGVVISPKTADLGWVFIDGGTNERQQQHQRTVCGGRYCPTA
ncbi:LysR substrate-binding domain-containing protein [Halomonas sp. SpR8]|uniref:LysR substrate-binding domain-containing protein n=1 Tax=Halomonas sp. SpR8 TaxID=3050463 RepID=UPI0027E434CC|nr:LysR substrate-binding domain-containing protein [Halomonas sp. SpR8]MDQ7729950.1 LysR substrate-binding domain-containing protein [Halomonas sp. SpR8]